MCTLLSAIDIGIRVDLAELEFVNDFIRCVQIGWPVALPTSEQEAFIRKVLQVKVRT